MFRKLAATVAVSAALISPSSWSLGLGEIDADSGLNQPLKAEIALLSSRNVSEEDLRAKLASYESYSKFGVQREAYHNSLSFKIITKNDGTKAIVVESRDPIKEPFVNFLLELNWAQGRLMREYTLLLDPPVFAKTTPTPPATQAPVSQPRTVTQTPTPTPIERQQPVSEPVETQAQAESQQTEPKAEAKPKPSQPEITEQTRQLASTPTFSGDSWQVERGQTLWSVAKSVRPEGVSVQQTLLAIFHNNPDAFINNDMNRMKAGAVLTVPESGEISDISQSAAVSTIRNAAVTSDAPLDVRKSVEEEDVEDTASSGGRLSIGSVDEGSSQDSGGSTLDDEMNTDVADNDSEVATSLEEGDSSSEFGSDLAENENAADDGFKVEDETLSVLSGAASAADETDQVSADEPAAEIAANTLDATESDDADSSETSVSETDEQASNEQETPPVTKSDSSMENSSKAFYEADNFWLYAGGGLAILLLLGGGLVYRRNMKEVEDDGGLLGMMTAANEAKPKKKRESFIGDEGMKGPKEKTDPVSAADILIARGKLAKAENVLEDALAADPGNQEIRVKLMEVVASQQNIEKFNQLKAELPEDFDHDSSLGLKVASLSSLIEPNESELDVSENSNDFSLPSEDDVFGDGGDDGDTDLDLSEEIETAKDNSVDTVTSSDDDALDFDLGDFDKQVEDSAKAEESGASDNSIDFTDDEELVTREDELSTNDSEDSAQTDTGGPGLSADDATTKFDLAKAYMELGDDDAAKDILEEIKSEGNSEQRQEADKLLSEM
ncbi:FimV/HubP family polar landmark protein [Kangiella marina]|uniref:Motility hub landmark protein FimV n=1 Tax=Kangiella marina TaxID=1079178 RepID=A0ABP8IBT4_9GAMM